MWDARIFCRLEGARLAFSEQLRAHGMLQLGRRFTGHDLKPAYTEEEIFEVTTTATTCILLLVGGFLAVQNHPDESTAIERLIKTYGPASKR
jgi:hypothetical protein